MWVHGGAATLRVETAHLLDVQVYPAAQAGQMTRSASVHLNRLREASRSCSFLRIFAQGIG